MRRVVYKYIHGKNMKLEDLFEQLENYFDYESTPTSQREKVKIIIDGEVVYAKSVIIDDNNEFFINCDEWYREGLRTN